MSLKDFFEKTPQEIVSDKSLNDAGDVVESGDYIAQYTAKRNRFIPNIDYNTPANFAIFGSAKEYYTNAVNNILDEYPYDGSLAEKLEWENNLPLIEKHVFENEYPRTNGYATIAHDGWGTSASTEYMSGITSSLSNTPEYIFFKSGPHVDNVYSVADNRTRNIKLNLDNGFTFEFWMKRNGFISASNGQTDVPVLVDLWNGEASGSAQYGRMIFSVGSKTAFTASNHVMTLHYASGAVSWPMINANSWKYTPTFNLADGTWRHYAFSMYQDATTTYGEMYVNGQLAYKQTKTATFGEITGSFCGTLMAGNAWSGITEAPGTLASPAGRGCSHFSGSIDEFRFWNRRRTPEEIGRYYLSQVGGGTNTDDANINLGIYYKFNEGKVGSTSVDATVLDYSGRTSNGSWYGYTANSRNTGSAIVESGVAASEFRDPIMYAAHPTVAAYLLAKQTSGSQYDQQNGASFYHLMPSWIIDEDDPDNAGEGHLLRMTQIMSSYLDNLHMFIRSVPDIKNIDYYSGSYAPAQFSHRLLTSYGLDVPELFVEADLIERFLDRSEDALFESSIAEVKSKIYQNLYNNLTSIYKQKGTEHALRNAMRCFGVDTELIHIGVYGSDTTFTLESNLRPVTQRKNTINFNDPDRINGTVYQYTGSAASYETSSIKAQTDSTRSGLAMSAECEIILPLKETNTSELYYPYPYLSSSLFGCYQPDAAAATNNTRWNAAQQYGNFQVYAVRDETESKNVYFYLTSSAGALIPAMSSSLFEQAYSNQKWNIAVTVKPKYIDVLGPGNLAATPANTYEIHFYGCNTTHDYVTHEFLVSRSLAAASGENFVEAAKRFYVGSIHQNFTGSVNTPTDVKVSSLRVWDSALSTAEIKQHSLHPLNYGKHYPLENVGYVGADTFLPSHKSLLLNWDFQNVSIPDANGHFTVQDASSGSANVEGRYSSKFTALGWKYPGRGDFFPAADSGSISRDYMFAYKQNVPESLSSLDMISIGEDTDKVFTKDTRPIDYHISLEKSPYRTLSEEMINAFASMAEYANFIGTASERYSQDYKPLEKMRHVFFEKVENTPDAEKYFKYFKWLDSALSQVLMQLVPASANVSDGIRNVIESHILERNKYHNKLPIIKNKDAVKQNASVFGIQERLYNWKYGHAPVSGRLNENRIWQKYRKERV